MNPICSYYLLRQWFSQKYCLTLFPPYQYHLSIHIPILGLNFFQKELEYYFQIYCYCYYLLIGNFILILGLKFQNHHCYKFFLIHNQTQLSCLNYSHFSQFLLEKPLNIYHCFDLTFLIYPYQNRHYKNLFYFLLA